MRSFRCALGASLAGLLCCLSAASAGAAQHPDFAGVWNWYVEPGKSPFAGPGAGPSLPFTPEGKKRVAAYQALVAPTSDNPGGHCLGSGMPESMVISGGYPMEIVQSPEVMVILYEAHSELRHVYLGGKIIPLPDRIPARDGYSAAHWEGDTLVVETTALKEQEDQMYPHSDHARIQERYRLTSDAQGAKVLVANWTLTDPAFYTQPVVGEKKWLFDPKGILLPYECNEEGWLDHLQSLQKALVGKHAVAPASATYK